MPIASAPIPAQSHGTRLTAASPSPTSRRIERMLRSVFPRTVRGTDMQERITAETPNVPASTAIAAPTPSPATRRPPSAGPASLSARGRLIWLSEFACVRISRSTRSGTIAP